MPAAGSAASGEPAGGEKDNRIMALTQDDFVSAVTKLNELTRLQLIKWQPCTPIPNDDKLGINVARNAFEATHEGRKLRITEFEHVVSTILSGRSSKRYVLDVRDQGGMSAFQFPEVAGLADLFRSIETQKLDIEGFIKKLAAG
jgi:hypothetical protein